jgi:hypothetical protein
MFTYIVWNDEIVHPDHAGGLCAVVIIHPHETLEEGEKMKIPCLRIPMKHPLKDKKSLQIHMQDLKDLFESVHKSLSPKKLFLILCENGLNASCATALALLSTFYDDNGMSPSISNQPCTVICTCDSSNRMECDRRESREELFRIVEGSDSKTTCLDAISWIACTN